MSAVPNFDWRIESFVDSEVVSAPASPASLSGGTSPERSIVSLTRMRTERPIGSMSTAVAVFDTHMERNPVEIMKPAIMRFVRSPITRRTTRAIRRCRFHFCIDRAMRNPPMKRKIVSDP